MKNLRFVMVATLCWSANAVAQQTPFGPVGVGPVPYNPAAIGGAFVNPTGVPSQYSATMSKIAAQSGILLDVFNYGGLSDSAAFAAACSAGVPILLGARAYTLNDVSCSTSPFILKGVAGTSIVQRASASTGSWFNATGAQVYIDGVTFDANKASVTANQWGVLLNGGGQTVYVGHSVFKNNSGTLGSGFALLSTGPAAGGSFTFEDNEVTGNAFNAAFFGSVTNGLITGNAIHDNTATLALDVSSYLTATSSNYASNIVVTHNRAWNNVNGINVGGIPSPYNFSQNWPASSVLVSDNISFDNSVAQIINQGSYVDVINNTMTQINVSSVSYGLLCNSSHGRAIGNKINFTNSTFGMDCGGAISPYSSNNTFTMANGTAIDFGGTQNAITQNDVLNLSSTAAGITVYATEGDGNGVAFPTTTSGLIVRSDQFNMSGSSTSGINIYDDAGGFPGALPSNIQNSDFNLTNSASSSRALIYFSSARSLIVQGNRVNGDYTFFVDPNSSNDLAFPEIFDRVQTIASVGPIRSVVGNYINNYNGGGTILWAYPSSQGSGYTAATVLTETCASTNPTGYTATPLINQGNIIGARLSGGTGCTGGSPTVTASDTGGGTGAVFVASNTPQLPAYKRVLVTPVTFNTVQRGGGAFSIQNTSLGAMFIDQSAPLTLDTGYSAGAWEVIGNTPELSFSTTSTGSCTGYIASTTLTCTSGQTGLAIGQFVTIAGGAAFTRISAGSGNNWTVYPSQTVGSSGAPLSITTSAVPPCTSSTSAGSNASRIFETGTTSSMWEARCNGTNWVYPNGAAVDGNTPAVHYQGIGTAPTIAAGTGAGTSPTISLDANAHDAAFDIILTTGTSPTASSTIATVTFGTAYATQPHCSEPGRETAATAALNSTSAITVSPSASTYVITAGSTQLAAATSYRWSVTCTQ